MASETGPATDPLTVLAALRERPERFDFFEALRRVECAWPELPRLGTATRPADEPIRLGQKPSLDFPPTALASVEVMPDSRLKIIGYFLGLFGPHGPLPLHLTEYVHDRVTNARDTTLVAFANVFHHRMLELFYRAWANTRPTVHFDRWQQDQFASYVAALVGVGAGALRNADALPDRAKLYYSGVYSGGVKTRAGLEALLADYIGMPVTIEECVGEWLGIAESEFMRLGNRNTASLGSCVLGAKVWCTQHKFRIVIGPVEVGQLLQYLPGGASLERLKAAVMNYVGFEYAWDLKFVLRRARVPPAKLGQFGHLGWTGWLAPPHEGKDADDVIIDVSDHVATA